VAETRKPGPWLLRIIQRPGASPVVTPVDGVSNLNEAWLELRRVAADLVPVAIRDLRPVDKWQIELVDSNGDAVFRISVVAELATVFPVR
jgi:hypothetical protein